jgi:hypothetical protein
MMVSHHANGDRVFAPSGLFAGPEGLTSDIVVEKDKITAPLELESNH